MYSAHLDAFKDKPQRVQTPQQLCRRKPPAQRASSASSIRAQVNNVRAALSKQTFAERILQLALATGTIAAAAERPDILATAAAATAIPRAAKLISRTARSIFKSGHQKGIDLLPPALPGTEYRSIITDTGATLNCQRTHDNCYKVQSSNIPIRLAAAGTDMNISQCGMAAVVVYDEDGRAHIIKMGKTLIDSSLTNLFSPSASFKNSDDVHGVWLHREDSHLLLRNGSKVPIRWDGRLFYLDYLHPTGISTSAPQLRSKESLNAVKAQLQEDVRTFSHFESQLHAHPPQRARRRYRNLPSISERRMYESDQTAARSYEEPQR